MGLRGGNIFPVTRLQEFAGWSTSFFDNSSAPKFGQLGEIVRQRKKAISRRVVAPLGCALNDKSGAVLFAARRTTNREPPK